MKSKFYMAVGFLLVLSGIAFAGSIKTFGFEVLRSADLNANFSHIHNSMVGGHGARLVDADVAASAAISHAKLAAPALVPKAWAMVGNPCAASPCTVLASSGVSGITRTGAGVYVATWTATRADTSYGVTCTCNSATALICYLNSSQTTTTVTFACITVGGVLTDSGFTLTMMDNL